MVPPVYSGTLQAEYSVSPRSIQDLVAEGYGGYDVDALNPSLTDLQLQGSFIVIKVSKSNMHSQVSLVIDKIKEY